MLHLRCAGRWHGLEDGPWDLVGDSRLAEVAARMGGLMCVQKVLLVLMLLVMGEMGIGVLLWWRHWRRERRVWMLMNPWRLSSDVILYGCDRVPYVVRGWYW